MIEEGATGPTFALPAVVGGETRTIELDDYLGDEIVVLAFYPGDFRASGEDRSDLDALDIFTMQKDVTVLGISGDSVFSHRAFADALDLHVPLLADTWGTVAEAYGVQVEGQQAGYRTRRAVVVLDLDGTVAYAWMADDPDQPPDVDAVRQAVLDIGGEDAATTRYRLGYAPYQEARSALSDGLSAQADEDWVVAQSHFDRAQAAADEAAEHFDSAARFAETEMAGAYYRRAFETTSALSQAAEWFADAASAAGSGATPEAEELRADAQELLQTAGWDEELRSPDEVGNGEFAESDERVEQELDILEETAQEETGDSAEPSNRSKAESEETETIDDAELAEITAELEAQSAAVDDDADTTESDSPDESTQ